MMPRSTRGDRSSHRCVAAQYQAGTDTVVRLRMLAEPSQGLNADKLLCKGTCGRFGCACSHRLLGQSGPQARRGQACRARRRRPRRAAHVTRRARFKRQALHAYGCRAMHRCAFSPREAPPDRRRRSHPPSGCVHCGPFSHPYQTRRSPARVSARKRRAAASEGGLAVSGSYRGAPERRHRELHDVSLKLELRPVEPAVDTGRCRRGIQVQDLRRDAVRTGPRMSHFPCDSEMSQIACAASLEW